MSSNDPKDVFQDHIRAQLRSIPVPPDLRDRILSQRKGRVIRVAFWKYAVSMAAVLAILALGVSYWLQHPREDRSFAGFEARMVGFAVREYRMDFLTRDFSELRGKLAAGGSPHDVTLPAPLLKVPLKGGANLRWQGKPVSMICFDGPSNRTLYLFVVESAVTAPETLVSDPHPMKGLSSASWTADGKTYLLSADLPPADLRTFL